MEKEEAARIIEDLLDETGKEHHQAFLETNGKDPEWPLWYAGYLKEKLSSLLDKEITKSELVFLLISAENKKVKSKSQKSWQKYYADFIAENFLK